MSTVPRYDHYQTGSHVILSIYKKGLEASEVVVQAEERDVKVIYKSQLLISLDPLFGAIDSKSVVHKVFGTKIELKLPKSSPGAPWPTLLAPTSVTTTSSSGPSAVASSALNGDAKSDDKDDVAQQAQTQTKSQGQTKDKDGDSARLSAGSSDIESNKDDDKIEIRTGAGAGSGPGHQIGPNGSSINGTHVHSHSKDGGPCGCASSSSATSATSVSPPISSAPNPIQSSGQTLLPNPAPNPPSAQAQPQVQPKGPQKKKKDWSKIVEEEEKKDAEGKEADSVDHFFQKLYKDLDPDSRRAMMKSYTESGGTTLSTDWKDIGSKTTPIHPPEGIEAKKWPS